jgi:Flp pilus assembly protein TadB
VTGLLAAVVVAAAALVWPSATGTAARRLRRLGGAAGSGSGGGAGKPRGCPADLSTPILMELVAAGLDAGLPASSALGAAVQASGDGTRLRLGPVVNLWRLGASVDRAWRDADERWEPLGRSLILSERTGASAAAVLRASARDQRARRRRRARVGANRLGVRLVIPLGLATLPAFVLLAVAPVALGLAQQALVGG